MTRWLPIMALSLAFAACEDDVVDSLAPFRDALPDEATLEISMPGEDVDVGELALALGATVGEPSELREYTGRARKFLNETIGSLLESYRELVATRPTLRSDDRVVWYKRAPFGDFEHLLAMVREDETRFTLTTWVRDGRRTNPDARWRFLAYGDLSPSKTLGDGRGAFYIDFDNDMRDLTRGKVVVLFSAVGARRQMDVLGYAATAVKGELAATRGFRFVENEHGSSLAFDAGQVNIHIRPDHNGLERVRVVTRWTADGRFRSDYSATSDEVTADGFRMLVGSECWVAGDNKVRFELVGGIRPEGGVVSIRPATGDIDACASSKAAIPVLPEPGPTPTEPEAPPETDPSIDWER